jgi:hypothetical protein
MLHQPAAQQNIRGFTQCQCKQEPAAESSNLQLSPGTLDLSNCEPRHQVMFGIRLGDRADDYLCQFDDGSFNSND